MHSRSVREVVNSEVTMFEFSATSAHLKPAGRRWNYQYEVFENGAYWGVVDALDKAAARRLYCEVQSFSARPACSTLTFRRRREPAGGSW